MDINQEGTEPQCPLALNTDVYAPTVMWWSWEQALKRAHQAGVMISMSRLRHYGRKGCFPYGKKAGSPCKKFPVKRIGFEQWLAGKGK